MFHFGKASEPVELGAVKIDYLIAQWRNAARTSKNSKIVLRRRGVWRSIPCLSAFLLFFAMRFHNKFRGPIVIDLKTWTQERNILSIIGRVKILAVRLVFAVRTYT